MSAAVRTPPAPLSVAELVQRLRDPAARAEFSPLGAQSFLLLALEKTALAASSRTALAAALRALPCPVIGVGAGDEALALACDARVDTPAAAAPLIANIERCPLAAAVLVQTLRATESLTLEQALVVESLAYATLQAGPEFRRWLATRDAPPAPTMNDAGPAVLVARAEDTLTLELNRPAKRNAMTVEMRDALVEALQLALADESVRRIHIAARGKCFSTGGELVEFGTAPDAATAHAVRQIALPGRLLAACVARGVKVQVRVHGACIGSGIEFPAFATRIEAAPDAWFQLPELRYGLIPGAGGCVSIARRIGRQNTAWLALSGKRIDAQRALELGLVDDIDAASVIVSASTRRLG